MSEHMNTYIDESMLRLFKDEALGFATTIKNCSESLCEPEQNLKNIQKIQKNILAIKSSAAITGLIWATELTKLMDDVVALITQNNIQLQRAEQSHFNFGIDYIIQFCQNPGANPDTKTSKLENCTLELANLVNRYRTEDKVETASIAQHPCMTEAEPQGNTSLVDSSMLELFRQEAETNTATLTEYLLALELNPKDLSNLEHLMRAAHSIKGAARMIKLEPAVTLAHLLEDCFDGINKGKITTISAALIDVLLTSVDIMKSLSLSESAAESPDFSAVCTILEKLLKNPTEQCDTLIKSDCEDLPQTISPTANNNNGALKISANRMNTLMGLSSDMLIATKWVRGHTDSLFSLKRKQTDLTCELEKLLESIQSGIFDSETISRLVEIKGKASACQQDINERLVDVEEFDRRAYTVATMINQEVMNSRMRPFSDAVTGLQRMARDLARGLEKEVNLTINGLDTQVDREIIEKIKSPLTQLLRNAIDHGIEAPDERERMGKPRAGNIAIEAFHKSGMLSISITDDGKGVELEALKQQIVSKGYIQDVVADHLSKTELLEFLFLPGFTTKSQVTELSGRGFGLDIAQSISQDMRGKIIPRSDSGKYFFVELILPLTLSIVRCLTVNINKEPYAFPLALINTVIKIQFDDIKTINNRQYINHADKLIGLVDAAQILCNQVSSIDHSEVVVVILNDRENTYGLIIDEYLGEHELSIKPIDSKIGKIRDISSAAILDNGDPVLVIDVDDIIRSIENLISDKRLHQIQDTSTDNITSIAKRILIVDDSLTVRELQRKLLIGQGYSVDVAVDGVDGWNFIRLNHYDMIITDIDMPRMNGIELVRKIKADSTLASTPVMIMSYKDRQQDKDLGLEAGADYYMAKGNFHDELLLNIVADLIGEVAQ